MTQRDGEDEGDSEDDDGGKRGRDTEVEQSVLLCHTYVNAVKEEGSGGEGV